MFEAQKMFMIIYDLGLLWAPTFVLLVYLLWLGVWGIKKNHKALWEVIRFAIRQAVLLDLSSQLPLKQLRSFAAYLSGIKTHTQYSKYQV